MTDTPPARWAEDIDASTYGKNFDPSNKDNHKTGIVNGHLVWMMERYKELESTDATLFEDYQDDFKEWTEDIWKLGKAKIVREFRDFLCAHGVYVPRAGDSVVNCLISLVHEKEQHEWTI